MVAHAKPQLIKQIKHYENLGLGESVQLSGCSSSGAPVHINRTEKIIRRTLDPLNNKKDK